MSNRDIDVARGYHEATRLTYINLRNKPPLYKSYDSLPAIALTPPTTAGKAALQAPTLEAVAGAGQPTAASLDLATLAQLLFFSAGLVRKSVVPAAGEVHYRAAASAGALYPIETYVVCRDIPDLEAGVYHFSPVDSSLRQLRKGDYRGVLARTTGGDGQIALAPATLVFTTIFWRSAWKYRARSYRYCLWDCGTMLANLLATASAIGMAARVAAGFVDSTVDNLLGIRGEQEASLCLVPLDWGHGAAPPPSPDTPDLRPLAAASASTPEDAIAYQEIRQMHAASCLATEGEVSAWRDSAPTGTGSATSPSEGPARAPFYPLPGGARDMASGPLGKVILGRGSTRRFARESISYARLGAMLDAAAAPTPADFLGVGQPGLVDIYAIANAAEGLPSGAYVFNRAQLGLELLKEGDFREEAGHLCFEQALGADASAVVFLMADLERILASYGNRGYRAAQLEAGIIGGRLYLGAHSLGVGASGITFYDDDVTDFFSPHAAGKSVMFVVTLGVTARENRVRPFRSRVGVMLDALARGAR